MGLICCNIFLLKLGCNFLNFLSSIGNTISFLNDVFSHQNKTGRRIVSNLLFVGKKALVSPLPQTSEFYVKQVSTVLRTCSWFHLPGSPVLPSIDSEDPGNSCIATPRPVCTGWKRRPTLPWHAEGCQCTHFLCSSECHSEPCGGQSHTGRAARALCTPTGKGWAISCLHGWVNGMP